jgi:hypothetical protein
VEKGKILNSNSNIQWRNQEKKRGWAVKINYNIFFFEAAKIIIRKHTNAQDEQRATEPQGSNYNT